MQPITYLEPGFLRARLSAKWSSFPAPIIPSNPAEMDIGVAPAIQAAMQQMVSQQQYGYSTRGPGSPHNQLAESFCRRMDSKFGWSGADPARVVVVNDLIQAVMATIIAFSDPHQGIALQVPCYPAFLTIIAQSGRRAILNTMRNTGTRFEIDTEHFVAIADEQTRLLVLCLPQNPTGRVFDKAELAGVVAHAVANDMIIVADEIHADLVFDGRKHVPFACMFPEAAERTITLYSATKTFNIPGLRTAVMHFGSDVLMRDFHNRVPQLLLGTPASPGTSASIAAWDSSEDWCQALIAALESSRNHIWKRLGEELPGAKMFLPEATYLAWIDFSNLGLNLPPYEQLLVDAKVAGGDGRNFGPGYDDFVRLNFATSPAILDEKLDRIFHSIGDSISL